MTDPDISNFKFSILKADYTVISNEWSREHPCFDPFSRLYLIDRGKAQIEKNGKRYTLAEGSIYLLPEKTHFRHIASPGTGHYWIHFMTRNNTGMSISDFFNMQWKLPLKSEPCVLSYFKSITRLFRDNSASASLEKQALIRLLFALFIRDTKKRDTGLADKNSHERLHKSLSYIEENLTQPLSIEEISNIAHLHPNYFSNLFRQHFGMPPLKYVLKKRIERAQILLCSTEKPVKNIAIETGYDDPCYFTRFFKKQTGMTPLQYRKSMEIYS